MLIIELEFKYSFYHAPLEKFVWPFINGNQVSRGNNDSVTNIELPDRLFGTPSLVWWAPDIFQKNDDTNFMSKSRQYNVNSSFLPSNILNSLPSFQNK